MRPSAYSASPSSALERAFTAASLIAAGSAVLTAILIRAGFGLQAVSVVTFAALLICAVIGIWMQDHLAQHQRGELARVYATALQGKRDRAVERRAGQPTRLEAAGLAMAGLIDDMRAALLGRDSLARWVTDARAAITARLRESEELAARLQEDAHVLVEAASGSRRAEADLVCRLGQMRGRAEHAVRATGDLADAVTSLTEAVKDVTSHSIAATRMAERLSDTAFNTQMRVSGLTENTSVLLRAADQIQAVLHRGEMLGLNASIEAARAGSAGTGFGVVAAEVKMMAQAGAAALEEMLETLRAMQADVTDISQRVQSMGDVVAAQHQFGEALAHAAAMQGDAVERLVGQADSARGEVHALHDTIEGFRLPETRLGAGAGAEQAMERLPGYAEAIARILRGLPDFRPASGALTDK